MICSKKASTNIDNSIEKVRASCLGTCELLLVVGDLHVVVGAGDLLLLGSNVGCSGRSGKTKGGREKQG